MSWDAYITQLKATETVTEAGIFGLDGSKWASSEGLKDMTPEEVKVLAGDSSPMRCCGPKVAGKKCMLLTDDRDNNMSLCLHLKTSEKDGKLAVCVAKSKTAMVLVMGSGAGNQLTGAVFKMVTYLKENSL